MKSLLAAAFGGVIVLVAGVALAQQHQHGQHMGAGAARPADSRVEVSLPAPLKAHMLANMRDHLAALEEIQRALSEGENARAARIAEQRLGLSSLSLHGAGEVATYMPAGMQDAGTGMHRAASRFVIAAQDASVTGDLKPSMAALADVTAQCVGCHAGYRLK